MFQELIREARPELVQQRRRCLDVGEQERHRSLRELAHRGLRRDQRAASPSEALSQIWSPVDTSSPSSALAGLPRTTVNQPRGSISSPYSPASKSAYVSPGRASAVAETASTATWFRLSSPAATR